MWWNEIAERLGRAVPHVPSEYLIGLVVAALAIGFTPLWGLVRLFVTLVHELGHAIVGVLVGRQFTGFVLNTDASGHAVTRGKPRGPGLVATAWAGYPAPAVVGAVLVLLAAKGWAGAALLVLALIGVVALTRVRSVLTAVITLLALAGVVGAFWFGTPLVRTAVLAAFGVVLIAGAWRHLAAVGPRPRGGDSSDPGRLAQVTGVPRVLWLFSFAVVLLAATLLAAWVLIGVGGWDPRQLLAWSTPAR